MDAASLQLAMNKNRIQELIYAVSRSSQPQVFLQCPKILEALTMLVEGEREE